MSISATTRGLRPGVCTSSTRPGSPYDGQLIYETDTNRVAVYDTNTWVYKTPASTTGSVLQVVSTTKTDTFSLTSTTFTDITGFNATITPSATSSKVLVLVAINGISATGNPVIRLVRGSTSICLGDAAGVRQQASNGTYGYPNLGFHFLDSPSTTSATTYKVQLRGQNSAGAAISVTLGATGDDADRTDNARFPITITLMEIAG